MAAPWEPPPSDEPQLLIDQIYRATFENPHSSKLHCCRNRETLRKQLRDAHRFVFDDGMSAFLADLTKAIFYDDDDSKRSHRTIFRLVDQTRTLARLPFAATWMEYSFDRNRERHDAIAVESEDPRYVSERADWIAELRRKGADPATPLGAATREGWLLSVNPKNGAFCLHLFRHIHHTGRRFILAFPSKFEWYTDEHAPTLWPTDLSEHVATVETAARYGAQIPPGGVWPSELLTGTQGYRTDRCRMVLSDYHDPNFFGQHVDPNNIKALLRGAQGSLREVWTALATINDIPITTRLVVSAKGFIGKGAYRRFLDHHTVTLCVPMDEDKRKLARKIVASARRRRHDVRGFWRKDYRNAGERIWVREHQRGDATLGFVTHDFVVKHETQTPTASNGGST